MKTFEARTEIPTEPARVIGLLTDPRKAHRWSPVDFDIEQLDGERLRDGTRGRVCGRVAGKGVCFDLSVVEASDRHLSLSAVGPFEVHARYEADRIPCGTEVKASVAIASSGGLRGRLVGAAAEALLAGGILRRTLERIAEAADLTPDAVVP